MGPYSHIILAQELIPVINPKNVKEYYWGSVSPDVRYVDQNVSKKQTHLSTLKILELVQKYPEYKDFLKGYLIHCLSDKLEIKPIILNRFPFKLFKSRVTKSNSTVILEYLNIELLNYSQKTISGGYNQIFKEIGINKMSVEKFSGVMSDYIFSPSSESSFLVYRNLVFGNTKRIDKYEKLYLKWDKKWFKRSVRSLNPHLRKINKDLADQIIFKLNDIQDIANLI